MKCDNLFLQVQEEFDKVIELVDGNIPAAEMQFFEELYQYMLKDEGSWAIGDGFLCFIGKFKKSPTTL